MKKIIETLIAREIYINQNTLIEDLILKLNLDWVHHIENYYDESSEAVEEYLIHSTDIDEATWQELDVHEQTLPRQKALKPNHSIFTNSP